MIEAKQTYTVVLEPDAEGGFVVHVPALPEVCTQGETESEALANAREAIELALEERLAEGENIPLDLHPQLHKLLITVPYPSAA
jgi:antitoxin HicB